LSRDGCTEALVLAHGLTVEMLADLVRAGFVTATAECIVVGSRKIEIARVRITDAGRRAPAKMSK
jgi:hypothetical protein